MSDHAELSDRNPTCSSCMLQKFNNSIRINPKAPKYELNVRIDIIFPPTWSTSKIIERRELLFTMMWRMSTTFLETVGGCKCQNQYKT